jgi:heme oxygenase (mycobilin-producing)
VSIVRINAITVPPQAAEEFERRFAARAGTVSQSEGFEAFELLKPTDDKGVYFVYTRWRSEADFLAWRNGGAAAAAHQPRAGESSTPVAPQADLLSFDVIQQEYAAG